MISLFRRFSESWIARIFFIVMAVSFVGWGITSDLGRLIGADPTWVAKAGGEMIEIPAFQAEFQRNLMAESRQLQPGQDITTERRRQIGAQTLNQMIGQMVMTQELRNLRVVTPNEALLAAIHDMPAFKGPSGQFDRATFEAVLRNNNLTEERFLNLLRNDIAQRQFISAVDSAVAAPEAEVTPLFTMEFEKRSADMAYFPIAAQPAPPAPDEAVLRRWYDNHPDLYRTPEFRRIKAAELTPASLASEISVTEDDLRAYYQEHHAEFATIAKRSAEIVSAPNEAAARALADKWVGGADWAAMQAAATAAGASAIQQDDATAVEFPDPDLAKAVFAAPLDTVSAPVKGQLGWFVVKVTKIVAGGETSFAQAQDTIRARVAASKATDLMYERANKLDQLLGNGATLDDLPGDLGLIGVAGTLDAKGQTQEGEKAPIPGPPALRQAMIDTAFGTAPNDAPRLTEVPTPDTGGSAYFALVVDAVIPPGLQPFDAVKDRVLTDWTDDQKRREANAAATAMMAAVQGGQSFSDAATVAGVRPVLSPLVTRDAQDQAMPPALQQVLFQLKPHETTMVEGADGFLVAQLMEIVKPDPAADKTGYEQARAAISRSIGGDIGSIVAAALRQRAAPQVQQRNFDSIVQPR